MQETKVQSLGQEELLVKEMETAVFLLGNSMDGGAWKREAPLGSQKDRGRADEKESCRLGDQVTKKPGVCRAVVHIVHGDPVRP